ncbi:MAG: hypothetical protein E6I91_08315 [Chloroflexi bacterium]|nr:MAG: hypothetical protein E6I91_08315 [Chloroflexota bacterium]
MKSAAQHAESRRYLLPGEEYKTDAPRVVEPTSRVAMFTQVPQVIKMPQQPQAPAQDWSSHELRMRAGIYTAPEPARKRSRQFKKVGGAWVPIE